jgi:hypothetical protein
MKKTLFYLPLMVLTFGCAPKMKDAIQGIAPEGTFTGQFKLYHLNEKTGVVDTPVKANNLVLNMEAATGFKVTGDTTLHAGSYGGFVVSESTNQVQFNDKTFPTTGTPAKVHLAGIYQYQFDGTSLVMITYGALDTLEYYYKMTKTGN